jgi:hypothetical protein
MHRVVLDPVTAVYFFHTRAVSRQMLHESFMFLNICLHPARDSRILQWSVLKHATKVFTIAVLHPSIILSKQRQDIFLFCNTRRPALGPTQPPTHRVRRSLSFRIKWPGHKAEHSIASSDEVKNEWSHNSPLLETYLQNTQAFVECIGKKNTVCIFIISLNLWK